MLHCQFFLNICKRWINLLFKKW